MLKETRNVKQLPGEPVRRWFQDNYFDLIVWHDENNNIDSFQLCYDKFNYQRSLTWKNGTGYSHDGVDDGESVPGRYKSTPILVADGIFNSSLIADKFKKESKNIEENISDFVYKKIVEYK